MFPRSRSSLNWWCGDRARKPALFLRSLQNLSFSRGVRKEIVSVTLDRRAFAYYNVQNHDWTVDPGEFNVYVGSSSARAELTGKIIRQTPWKLSLFINGRQNS